MIPPLISKKHWIYLGKKRSQKSAVVNSIVSKNTSRIGNHCIACN